jgi:hypothetical protein
MSLPSSENTHLEDHFGNLAKTAALRQCGGRIFGETGLSALLNAPFFGFYLKM